MVAGTDIHAPLRTTCYDFGDPLTFHLAPSSGQQIWLWKDAPPPKTSCELNRSEAEPASM